VEVNEKGKSALTVCNPIKVFPEASLMEVKLFTGRTHQIRVHAAHQAHHIAGDDRYGDGGFNKVAKQKGLKRMFLHAHSIEFTLPSFEHSIKVVAPLDKELELVLQAFDKS